MVDAKVDEGELCNIVLIENQRGLHARAAARLVRVAEEFHAEITIGRDETKVSARSIMGLLMLAAGQGTSIRVCATGIDAVDTVEAISDLVKRKFDEE
jgi:phosphocarrier protein